MPTSGICPTARAPPARLAVRLAGKGIGEAVQMELTDLDAWLSTITGPVAEPLVHKMRSILSNLIGIGVGYLSLNRAVATLSGGESQRLKLAAELGKAGQTYILDEPTTGLHLEDISRLMAILNRLVADGNSVIVIEHNLHVIAQADWVIDLGPEGGSRGGRVLAVGTPEQIARCPESHTGRYLKAMIPRSGVG